MPSYVAPSGYGLPGHNGALCEGAPAPGSGLSISGGTVGRGLVEAGEPVADVESDT
jgi:hypothetical protein